MADKKPLFLYEEILLLALHNEKGTVASGYLEYAVAGAVLAELLLNRHITIDESPKKLVNVHSAGPTGDPIIDECLEMMFTAKKRGSLQTWVSRLGGIKHLRHKVARQLCDRGIVRADEDKVLYLFTRKIYPEINPVPETKIVERLRKAIFTDHDSLDPHTVVLVSLANSANLLGDTFGKKELKSRNKRIEQIVNGELTGKAAKEVISACETAVMMAAIFPVIIASTSN